MILTNENLVIKPDFITSSWEEFWGQPDLHKLHHKLLPAYAQRFHLKPMVCKLL